MREAFLCGVLLGRICVRKSGGNVYRVIPAVSAYLRPHVPFTLGSRADLGSFVASVHVKM